MEDGRRLFSERMSNNVYTELFFFNDTATTEIYTLSLHDALPIYQEHAQQPGAHGQQPPGCLQLEPGRQYGEEHKNSRTQDRPEEHTSELQSRQYLVCRLLLEKKKIIFLFSILFIIILTFIQFYIS